MSRTLLLSLKSLNLTQENPHWHLRGIDCRESTEKTIDTRRPQKQGGYGKSYSNYNKSGKYNNREQRNNQQREGDFSMGTAKPENPGGGYMREKPIDIIERNVVDENRKKIQEDAAKTIDRIRKEKTTESNIRLYVNQIAPDNFEKKFEQLREAMFGDLKHKGEKGYDEEIHSQFEVQTDSMGLVVETIFKKAQNEKEYCVLYGDLVEKIITLELKLKGIVDP